MKYINMFQFFLIFSLSFSVIYADSNGIWNRAEDLIGGILGNDEQSPNMNFTFINPVYFLDKLFSNEISTQKIISTNICLNGVCKTTWPTNTGSSLSSPPVCTGTNALQWTGSSWSCTTFAPGCSNGCSYVSQTTCSGSYVLTCGNYDSDSCLEWNSGSYCSNGCSGSSCVSCTSHSSSSCYSGDVYWYDSCGNRQTVKESCSDGCSGSSCISCNSIDYIGILYLATGQSCPSSNIGNWCSVGSQYYISNSCSGGSVYVLCGESGTFDGSKCVGTSTGYEDSYSYDLRCTASYYARIKLYGASCPTSNTGNWCSVGSQHYISNYCSGDYVYVNCAEKGNKAAFPTYTTCVGIDTGYVGGQTYIIS